MIARMVLVALLALGWAPAAWAQRVPVPVMGEAEIKLRLGADELEGRLDGDLDGDGEVDTVYVQRGEDSRKLSVMVAYRSEVDLGHDPVGELTLDPYPLGPASLEIRKGVLVVDDLTGGTSATAATYRYRFDPAKRRMRLIGLDAKFYSRTNNHGWRSVSWNLLTGAYIEEEADLIEGPEKEYGPVRTKRGRRLVKVVWMEDTPSAEALVTPQVD
jgi:hypothetical protein